MEVVRGGVTGWDLTNELKRTLLAHGAALVGIADMTAVPGCAHPRGVSAAVPLPPSLVRDLQTAPTLAYHEQYHTLNRRLDGLVSLAERILQETGHQAYAQTTDRVTVDADRCSPLPHKTVAIRAGLGWIGRSGLLVTPSFGSAVRLSSLLTDAPLVPDAPTERSRCGKCALCATHCPAQAIHGATWSPDMARAELVDVARCYETQCAIMYAQTGLREDLCGKCFAVCAYTRGYLKRSADEDAPSPA